MPVRYEYKGWQIYDYYQWLLEKVDGHVEPYYNYSLLLHELHSMPFKWGLEMDENRAIDGVQLRWEYMDENLIPDIFYQDDIPCSVLEMLIGLSIRFYDEVMWDFAGSSVSFIFWAMIENLGLMKSTDEHFDSGYVRQQIDIWLDRNFAKNGAGSPFPIQKRRCRDQRKVTIWDQMCGYFSADFE